MPQHTPTTPPLHCSIGIMAHNEQLNIGPLLSAIANQQTSLCRISEIIIVASGCTDATIPEIEKHKSDIENRNIPLILITETQRHGKAEAINKYIAATTTDILILIGADTLPAPSSIENLITPFTDPTTGMTGARPIPLNDTTTFPGYAAHFLWNLHHLAASHNPKCGEMVAFRKTFHTLPPGTIVDEPQIEHLTRQAGLRLVYVPTAIVHNLGPATTSEIIMRRRSIIAGYIRLHRQTRYRPATHTASLIIAAHILKRIITHQEPPLRAIAVIAIELTARCLARLDSISHRPNPHIWPPATSTKNPASHL